MDRQSREEEEERAGEQQSTVEFRGKRRITFEAIGLEIEPYQKRRRITNRSILPPAYDKRHYIPDSYHSARFKDIIWMTEASFFPVETPMWVGWNSSYSSYTEASEVIWYLPQINISPTSNAVVRETMKRAQRMAVECNKENIAVTYDLAIAKMAMEIQVEEAPQFDNVFAAFGSFHVEMSYFGTIGKYIAESGGPNLLTECHFIEKGSLTSFLSGKSYERSKRMHRLLALAMEVLHFI